MSKNHSIKTVKTNNVPRPLLSWQELPEEMQKECWDEDAQYFIYKGYPYCLGDFVSLRDTPRWDGVQGETYWSAIVIRVVPTSNSVVVGYMVEN